MRKTAPGMDTMHDMDAQLLRAVDSINHITSADRGRVVVASSHGGLYCAYKALAVGARGVVLSDAGVGREQAGIASLAWCEVAGMPAATVAHTSARIGDVADLLRRGVVSHANASARALGVTPGMSCVRAWQVMTAASVRERPMAPVVEHRHEVALPGGATAICIDSASLIHPDDAGGIVITGSHGGLIGGDPGKALNVAAAFAAFNDAGVGIDEAGLGRLAPLAARGIAAVTVAHTSARIGDGLSTLHDGVISHANKPACELGAIPGRRLLEALAIVARGVDTQRSVRGSHNARSGTK